MSPFGPLMVACAAPPVNAATSPSAPAIAARVVLRLTVFTFIGTSFVTLLGLRVMLRSGVRRCIGGHTSLFASDVGACTEATEVAAWETGPMQPTVLIVDDHPAFRSQARALLESEGFAVVGEAKDGAEALAAVEALRPEVVLLDIQLPDLDGFEVAERLSARP